jgi:putative transposase
MVQYRREFCPRATYFFTVTLKNRKSSVLTQNINRLRQLLDQFEPMRPFKTHAIVVLPDHLHVIWELPKNDSDYSLRWRLIKTHFSKEITKSGILLSKNNRNEYALWQRRFWEHRIRDEADLMAHINYIHYNPVKHKLVKQPCEWKYSSIHRYIQQGTR